jgi:hypothetical protein
MAHKLGNGMANKFGQIQHNCLAKFRSFRVGETDWQLFAWPKKLSEIPGIQLVLTGGCCLEVALCC